MSLIKSTRIPIFCLYASGLLQGFLLESIPASSTIIKSSFDLSSENYGQLFIGQLVGVLIGSYWGARSKKWQHNPTELLAVSVLIQAISQCGLIFANQLPLPLHFIICLLGACCFGLGFGLSAPPINTLPGLIFPKKPDAALLVMHSLIGIGLAASPWLIGYTIEKSTWPFLQLAMLITGIILCLILYLSVPIQTPRTEQVSELSENDVSSRAIFKLPVLWIFIFIAICYALAEGTLNNWAVLYLTEQKQFTTIQATQVLSAFWSALAAGRMAMAGALLFIPASWVWIGLPILVVLSFIWIPGITSHEMGNATRIYIIAGLGCSAGFPLSIRFAIQYFKHHSQVLSSLMTAALMIGICSGSYVLGPLQKHFPLSQLLFYSAIWPVLMIVLSLWTFIPQKLAPSTTPNAP